MYVIRPRDIHGTPSALAADLGCQTRRWPNKQPIAIDYNRDFIMAVVPSQGVRNAPAEYADTYAFATRHKLGQRHTLLRAGVPAPACAGSRAEAETLGGERFVVRPLRHSRSRDYRVTGDRLDFREGQEYISELYPKRREYRVVFVYGQPLIWLRKKPLEGVPDDAPWGHENSRFQTIRDVAGSRIQRTDCVARLSNFRPVLGSHICAADVLLNDRHTVPYVVLEINFCPGLDIDNNRARVVERIRHRSVQNQGVAT